MTLKRKFAIAVLGAASVAGIGIIGVNHWTDEHLGKGTLSGLAQPLWQEEQLRETLSANMTPARHEIYEQVMRSGSEGPNGITCFTIPPGTGEADAKAVTKIIQAWAAAAENTRYVYVISRGVPAPGCKPPQFSQ